MALVNLQQALTSAEIELATIASELSDPANWSVDGYTETKQRFKEAIEAVELLRTAVAKHPDNAFMTVQHRVVPT